MKFLLVTALLVGIPAVPSQTQPPAATASAPAGNVDRGKATYVKDGCYECHGLEGQGSPASGPRLAQVTIPWGAFVRYIHSPTGEMPPYTTKVISEQELADVYAFLKAIPKPAAVQSIPLLQR